MENNFLKPLPLKELRKDVKPLRSAKTIFKEKLTPLETFAVWITKNVGSIGFFFIIIGWTALWFLWNTAAPANLKFDPFPAFVLWLFISNVIQLFLLPLLLIGQNFQSKHTDIRAEIDFEVNLKAEREIEAILLHLEQQQRQIERLMEILEKRKSPNKKIQNKTARK